jgi:hypothetical protein
MIRRAHLFDDVDVATPIEVQTGAVAVPHVIRTANQKTFRQIHDEIRAIQAQPTDSAQTGGLVDLAPRVPALVRDVFYWALRQNPHWSKAIQGTVIVTVVGMFGRGSGWGIRFCPVIHLGSRSVESAVNPVRCMAVSRFASTCN